MIASCPSYFSQELCDHMKHGDCVQSACVDTLNVRIVPVNRSAPVTLVIQLTSRHQNCHSGRMAAQSCGNCIQPFTETARARCPAHAKGRLLRTQGPPCRAIMQNNNHTRSSVCRATEDMEDISATQSVLELDPVYEGEYCSKLPLQLGL